MGEDYLEQIRRTMEQKSTQELLQIWEDNDREQWTAEAFEVVRRILEERGEAPGLQAPKAPGSAVSVENSRKHPGCVTVIAIYLVLGAVSSGLGEFVRAGRMDGGVWIALTFAALYLVIAAGLWQLKNWARIVTIILIGVNLLFMIPLIFSGLAAVGLPNLVVGGFIIYWLVKNSQYFLVQQPAEPPVPPSATNGSQAN